MQITGLDCCLLTCFLPNMNGTIKYFMVSLSELILKNCLSIKFYWCLFTQGFFKRCRWKPRCLDDIRTSAQESCWKLLEAAVSVFCWVLARPADWGAAVWMPAGCGLGVTEGVMGAADWTDTGRVLGVGTAAGAGIWGLLPVEGVAAFVEETIVNSIVRLDSDTRGWASARACTGGEVWAKVAAWADTGIRGCACVRAGGRVGATRIVAGAGTAEENEAETVVASASAPPQSGVWPAGKTGAESWSSLRVPWEPGTCDRKQLIKISGKMSFMSEYPVACSACITSTLQ